MDDNTIATHLENLDRRLARVEQILPTLATKDDLKNFATKDDLANFATKDDLLGFSTKEETREGFEGLRRHMDVIAESLRTDIQLLAEHLTSVMPGPRE